MRALECAVRVACDDLRAVLPGMSGSSVEDLEEDGAEREDVALRVDALRVGGLLGRHVAGRAEDLADRGLLRLDARSRRARRGVGRAE